MVKYDSFARNCIDITCVYRIDLQLIMNRSKYEFVKDENFNQNDSWSTGSILF